MYDILKGEKEHSEIIKLMENIDWELFARQKEWLYAQQIQLENEYGLDASALPSGILNMLDKIQDVWENEADNPCWYIETWNDDDLRTALKDAEIEITEKNILKLRHDCFHIFDDKSARNEMLVDRARAIFVN